MTHTNAIYESSRSDEDGHDQIGSTSATPSGVATPHPDPSDKRLPGIMHSYFGQVRARSSTSPSTPAYRALAASAMDHRIEPQVLDHRRLPEVHGNALLTAPSSPNEQSELGDDHVPPLLPHERLERLQQETGRECIPFPPYPTPPISSPSSSIYKETEEGCQASNALYDHASTKYNRPVLGRQQSATDVIPLRTRRHTASWNPLSNVITSSSVHAAHISNPTAAYPSTTPSTPIKHAHAISAHSSLTSSYLELAKLTDGVAASLRKKSTPPRTPRALSNDGVPNVKKTAAPNSNYTLPNSEESPAHTLRNANFSIDGPTLQPISATPPPVGPPKGKLSVKISEARGLRPSYDPYVVCVFEWNESISKGPKQEDVELEKEGAKSREDGLGGVPIRRSGSDMGRSMAIPMKSRQSSTASLSDQKNFRSEKQVTDPKWEHEAILYAAHLSSILQLQTD